MPGAVRSAGGQFQTEEGPASGGDSGNGGYSHSFRYRSEMCVLMSFGVKQITDGAANNLQKGDFHFDQRQ